MSKCYTTSNPTMEVNFVSYYYKLKPAADGTGFKMDGYYIWCGSVIKEDDYYYLFAARWKKEHTFPDGYMTNSEIVLAGTDDLNKPFKYIKTIISKRDGNYWDSMMAHNPYIIKIDNEYVLYYIGSPDGKFETRTIGYATSLSLDGEWKRCDTPIKLPPDANNPCVINTEENGLMLYFRDGNLRVSVAKAERYDGEYTVVRDSIFQKGKIEDMFVYNDGTEYIMIAEDNDGVYTGLSKGGVRFTSPNGLDWDDSNAVAAYGFDIEYTSGAKELLQRRERPMILFDDDKQYLFTTAKANGADRLTGGDTWNMFQEIDT